MGATKGPTFFCYKAEPGEHTLRIEADEPTTVELHAEGGKSYYLHEKVPSGSCSRCDASWVSEPKARELVDDSTYEVITTTPASEHPPRSRIPFAKAAASAPTRLSDRDATQRKRPEAVAAGPFFARLR